MRLVMKAVVKVALLATSSIMSRSTGLRFHQCDHVRIHLADDTLTSAVEQFLAAAYTPFIHCPGTGADLFGLISD